MEVICTAISAVATIIVAVISSRIAKDRKAQEKRAEQRAEESRLQMEMIAANIELSDVIAIAVSGGHINGNVEEARAKARQAKSAYYRFLNSIAIDTMVHL